jgi:hypothetical protein
MQLNGVWATDAEILGAASLLQTDIAVYASYGSLLKWLIYPSSFSLTSRTLDAIFISNMSGDHFDVVLS